MLGDIGKYLINFLLVIAAFFFVKDNPALAWTLAGVAAFLLFFLRSREAIFLYALYFAFEETILLHAPPQFLVLLKYLGDILILALFLGTFAKLAMRRYNLSPLTDNYLHIPIFLFLGVALVSSLLNQIPPFIAFICVRQLLRYLVLFYAVILTAQAEWTPEDLRNLIRIVIVLAFIQAGIGYLQLLFGPGSKLNIFLGSGNQISFGDVPIVGGNTYVQGRALYGTMITPNPYGLFLAGGFCLLYGVYLLTKQNTNLLIGLLFLLIPILKTYSRQSIYTCLVGFFVMGLLQKNLKVILVSILVVGSFLVYFTRVKTLAPEAFEPETIKLATRIISPFHPSYQKLHAKSGRFQAVREFAPKILASPYAFLGLGPGSVGSPFGYYRNYHEGYKKLAIPRPLIHAAHVGIADVGFVAILGQFGVVGFLCFYAMPMVLFWFILSKKLPGIQDSFYRGVTIGFLGYTIALIVSNVAYVNFAIRQISFYFWLMAGMICAIQKMEMATEQK